MGRGLVRAGAESSFFPQPSRSKRETVHKPEPRPWQLNAVVPARSDHTGMRNLAAGGTAGEGGL